MRKLWIDSLFKICLPILDLANKNQLKEKMPKLKNSEQQYLEALGRIICGIAPWLNLGDDETDEGVLRKEIKSKVLNILTNIVNPKEADYIDFNQRKQSLVDAAYLVQGLIRCPSLFDELTIDTQKNLLNELKKTREFIPPETNWLLFATIIEVFLYSKGEEIENSRLFPALDKFINVYYVGDGMYGDGNYFHFDHYNSFVIHPMLTDILEVLKESELGDYNNLYKLQLLRHKRYAEILERMISPEGTWPLVGRTLSCRIGVFHALSHAAYKKNLPSDLKPEQIRCALNSVLERFLQNENNFSKDGVLTIGLSGEQHSIAEDYISLGSSYHAVTFFTALGLPKDDIFWANPDVPWTTLRAFSGDSVNLDHAYDEITGTKVIVKKLFKQLQTLISNKIGKS